MNVKFWKTAGIAAGAAAGTVVFLLCLLVFWRLGARDPERGLGGWICLVLTLGGVLSAWLSARMGGTGWGPTLVCATLYLVAIFLLASPFGGNFTFNGFLSRFCLPLAAAALTGALLCKQGTTRQKNRRKATKHARKIYQGKR